MYRKFVGILLVVMQMTKNVIKYLVLAGLFAVPFIVFIIPSGMFFPFISGKGFTFRIIIEIIFGAFVVLAFLDAQYRPKFSWITKSVLFFTLAILVADLFSVNSYKSLWSNYERMEGFVLIAHLALYYIVASSVFRNLKNWNTFFNVSIISSVLLSFYGVLQLARKITINQGGVRVDGTFGNATYFAIYLVIHIFLCLYMLVDSSKPKWQKWLYGLIALFEAVILYYTATRGAILGLIGGLVLAAILIVWKEKENLLLKKISYGVIIFIVIFSGLFVSLRNTSFVKNSPVLSRFSSLGPEELKTQGRYFVWPMAIKGFLEKPILGWGQESFNFVFNKYYDPRMYNQEQWFDRTHDVFLDWLIAGGLVGFLAYASMYFALFYYIWRKKSTLSIPAKSVLTGMISAYIFHNIFVFDNLISYILFFSILAFVHSISSENEVSTKKFYTKIFSNDVIHYIVLPVAVVATCTAIYFVNVPAIEENKALIQAITTQGDLEKNFTLFKKVFDYNSFGNSEAVEQLLQVTSQIYSSQAPDSVKQEFYDFSKTKIEEKINQTPTDARYLVFAGSFFNRFGQFDLAIQYLERAIKESTNKQTIYFELGSSYLGKGDRAKAFETFKKAYDLEPDSQESKIIYAVGAIYTQNNSVLNQIIKTIDQNTLIGDNRIIKAYADIGDYTTVINILNARLQKNPTDKNNRLSLASVYSTIGQKQKAIDIIQAMIKENPNFKDEGEGYIKQIQSQ